MFEDKYFDGIIIRIHRYQNYTISPRDLEGVCWEGRGGGVKTFKYEVLWLVSKERKKKKKEENYDFMWLPTNIPRIWLVYEKINEAQRRK